MILLNLLLVVMTQMTLYMEAIPVVAKPMPLIFRAEYDVTFWGLEKLHPFDGKKYGNVMNYLIKHGGKNNQIHKPAMVTDQQLALVHTSNYLESLTDPATVAAITEIRALAWMPSWVVRNKVVNPMKYATGGTILGAKIALQQGKAINLSGGYHHAKADEGSGFCMFADIAIAAHVVWQERPQLRILIVDLDAHQGNGYASIFKNDPRVAIFDIYNEDLFPHDEDAKKYIRFNYPIHSGMNDTMYLALLKAELPKALNQYHPDLIIYNAGTDVFKEDAIGKLSLSERGIIERDAYVFEQASLSGAPILMLLSGGYTKKSADIIGKSIVNLQKLGNVTPTH